MSGVFVNYRTGDGDWAAERLARELISWFGEQSVFLASSSIRPGEDFAERILDRLPDCDVLLAIIGPHWLTSADQQGRRRIDDPEDWVHREIAIALEHDLIVIPVLLDNTGRLAETNLPTEIARLARSQSRRLRRPTSDQDIQALLVEVAKHLPNPACPYRGLKPFGESDARFFFGRETETRRLASLVGQQPVVVVVGGSGSGKSSLIRAGLVPTLRAENVAAAVIQPIPGQSPPQLLTAALDEIFGMEWDRRLVEDLPRLAEVVVETVGELVLCVDQFEELVAHDPEAAKELFNSMVTLARARPVQPGGRPALHAVFTVRSAHLDELLTPEFDRVADETIFLLRPMNKDDLTAAIRQPAAEAGRPFEQGLVERVVADALPASAQLPLVEFALTRLWESASPGALTHQAYEKLGGVTGALAGHAEQVYQERQQAGQAESVRRLLTQLIRPSDDGSYVLSPVRLDQLDPPQRELARALSKERLVVIRHSINQPEVVTIAHEALVREWPQLRGWLEAHQQFRTWQERLRAALRQWLDARHDPGALLRGAPLAIAKDWLDRAAAELTDAEQRYIITSSETNEREQTTARRRVRQLGWLLTGVLVFALVASVLAYVAFTQRSIAQEERDNAIFNQITAQANRFRGTDISLAAQLDLTAYRMRPNDQTLYTNLLTTENAALATTLTRLTGTIWAAAFSPDGRTVAVAVANESSDGEVRLWDVADRAHPAPLEQSIPGNNRTLLSLAFSPDGRTLAVAANNGTVQLWNVADPRHPTPFGEPITNQTDIVSVNEVVFSPDGRILATAAASTYAGGGSSLRLWNVADLRHPTPIGQPLLKLTSNLLNGPNSVTFSPDGRILAAGVGFATVRLWNVADPTNPIPQGQGTSSFGGIHTIAFSRDGHTLAGGQADGTVQLWNIADPGNPKRIGDPLTGHDGPIYSLAFSPDGQFLATAADDSTIRLWSTADPAHPSPLGQPLTGHADAVTHIAFGPDSHALVATSGDGAVRLWDIPDTILVTDNSTVKDVAFNHDSRLLAAAAVTVRLWNVADPQKPKAAGTPLSGRKCCISAMTLHPDGEIVAAADDEAIRLWNVTDPDHAVSTGQPEDSHTESVTTMAFSPVGHLLASGTDKGTVSLWRFARPNFLTLAHQLPSNPNGLVHSLAFSPDSGTIAIASKNAAVQLWDVTDPSLRIGAPAGRIDTSDAYAMAFSPDGRILATAGLDQKIRLWNVTDRANPTAIGQPIDTSARAVYSLAFRPDGRMLASGGYDHVVRLWNVEDPEHPTAIGQPLAGHADSVNTLTFSPDGQLLATGSADHTIRIWALSADQAIARICATTGNTLTPDTWRRYVSEQLPFNPPCR